MNYYRIGYAMNQGLLVMTPQAARQLTHLNLAFGRIEANSLTLHMLPDIGRIARIRQ